MNISRTATALVLTSLVVALPTTVHAQVTLGHTIRVVSDIVNGLIPIVLALTVLIFFWGLAMYLWDSGNSEKKGQGIHIMVMGVVALFVMVSIWGIIGVLQQTFKVDQAKPIVPDPIEQKRGGTVY
ncbi:hypothetical protein CL652_00300 [bacterium]|mgnify:CR=1 FL=1|nr:hypothetical protein [bacterium]|tara:strand:+ start:9339 stop:9716 length:378 start_codon:yes stop_codon:yes gene_type:complete